jgi:hypothetical protein
MGGFPALMIKPPESPVNALAGVQQLKNAQLQQQAETLQIQKEQQDVKDRNATTQALLNWDGKDVNQLPMLALRAGGSSQAAFGIQNSILGIRQKTSEIAKNDAATAQDNIKTVQANNDALRGRLTAAINSPNKESAWDQELTSEEQAGRIAPGTVPHQYPGDDAAKAFADHFALGSVLAKEAEEKQKLALEAWKSSGGMLVNPITNQKIGGIPDVAPLNKALETRYQVTHPGEPVPDYYQLKTGASPTDFDRVDKLLEAAERSTATKAQLATANAIRQQTYEMARDKADLQAVVGIDPKSGKQVLVPLPQAQQMGIQNPIKAEGQDVQRAMAGRQWLTLAKKEAPDNAPAEEKGIIQLIDQLDSEGKLGVLASRWNDFMARKLGSADTPEYKALATKMGLSSTLLAQAHAGARGAGSPYLLEHMEDLANAKKLDGPTLKAAFGAEVNYVEDRAMDPSPPNYQQLGGKTSTPKAKQGGMIRARDPQGKLHEAPAGTALPPGWKQE